MDKNEFFRQATLRICGNLEIEAAMQMLIIFLKDVMPVTRLFLQKFDHDYGAMRTIAFANREEYGKLDLLTPLSTDAQKAATENIPNMRDAFLLENPHETAASREMLKFHTIDASSLIIVVLRSKQNRLGSFVLISEGMEKFSDQHLKLALLLKEPLVIAMSNTLKHREVIKLNELLTDDNRYLHSELHRLSGDEIVGASFGLKEVVQQVQQVAALDSPVLLLGETGVGKDVIANFIHYSSARSVGPFVTVNCGAIPETLIDSELFGHEKGAFTGAMFQKRGRFERADKGTIFLDEIGELPLQAQVRLLRVLQSKEIERVGGVKTISLDIRIIAATNRNLEEMVSRREFREDLWFRLNVFPIRIPPLRERKGDIPALLQHFIDLKTKELKLPAMPKLSAGSVDSLMAYHWPGNVRELENVIERALILNPTEPLTFEHLNLRETTQNLDLNGEWEETDDLDAIISRHIRRVLSKTRGRVNGPNGAAACLGINPSTLRNRMKKLGIEYGRKRK